MLTGFQERRKYPELTYGYNIKRLLGKTLKSVKAHQFGEYAHFVDDAGVSYLLGRSNDRDDGYEHGEAEISEIIGELSDLLDSPVLIAEEVKSEYKNQEGSDNYLWTFYRIGTRNGTVTFRFNDYADTCQYYSIWVDFHVIPSPCDKMPMSDSHGRIVCERARKEKEKQECIPYPRIGDVVLESPVGAGVVDSINGDLPRVNGDCCAWVVTERGGLYDPGGFKPKATQKQ